MLTAKATPEMLRQWKQLFDRYHNSLKPNRRTGIELDEYFKAKYPFKPCTDPKFREAVEHNITENEYYCSKLPDKKKAQINEFKEYHYNRLRQNKISPQPVCLKITIKFRQTYYPISFLYHTGSEKVSGWSGLKGSFAHIRVTRGSVSLKFIMLWVYPGSK